MLGKSLNLVNLINLNFYILLYSRLLFVCLVSFVSMSLSEFVAQFSFSFYRNLSCVLSVEVLMANAQRQTTEIRSTVGNIQGCIWLLLVYILALIISLFPGEGAVSCRQPVASQVYWFPLIHVDILSSTAGFGILSESLESVHCGCRGEP